MTGCSPFYNQSYRGSDLLVWGIRTSVIHIPLPSVNIWCRFVSVRVGVPDQLPIVGIDLMLRNDLAREKVLPKSPEVTDEPVVDACSVSVVGPST